MVGAKGLREMRDDLRRHTLLVADPLQQLSRGGRCEARRGRMKQSALCRHDTRCYLAASHIRTKQYIPRWDIRQEDLSLDVVLPRDAYHKKVAVLLRSIRIKEGLR